MPRYIHIDSVSGNISCLSPQAFTYSGTAATHMEPLWPIVFFIQLVSAISSVQNSSTPQQNFINFAAEQSANFPRVWAWAESPRPRISFNTDGSGLGRLVAVREEYSTPITYSKKDVLKSDVPEKLSRKRAPNIYRKFPAFSKSRPYPYRKINGWPMDSSIFFSADR